MVYPYNGLKWNTKEWAMDTHNMDQSQNHTQWKKLETKGYILYHTIYVTFEKVQTNAQWHKAD